MVKFSFFGAKVFPDKSSKIVSKINERGETIYYINTHGKDMCAIQANSIGLPYTIEFDEPGKQIRNYESLIHCFLFIIIR